MPIMIEIRIVNSFLRNSL